jgi:hypothetical protein
MTTTKQSVLTIERFVRQVGSPFPKSAEAHTEPGSIGGATTHPVKSVDDNTQKTTEGGRSAENKADAKDISPLQIDNKGEATSEGPNKMAGVKAGEEDTTSRSTGGDKLAIPGSAEEDQLQIGTKKAPTGEAPDVETGSTKPGKEDTDTAHPASTDNDALNGGKFASVVESMPLEKLAAAIDVQGREVLAAIAGDQQQPTKQASDVDAAANAGWGLAEIFGAGFDKRAADALVQEKIAEIIAEAVEDADDVVEFLRHRKQAGDPAGGGGEIPTGNVPGAEAAMMAAAGGGGGDPTGGAMPPEAAAGGGIPGPEEIQELIQLLEANGMTLEDLEAMLSGDGGGAGGPEAGGPGAGGEAIPPPPPGGGVDPAAGGDGGALPKEAAAKIKVEKQAINTVREMIARSRRK